MKAKEYAKIYLENPTPQSLLKVASDMTIETKDIFEKRHAKTDEAMISIIKEAILKWRAFVRIVGDRSIKEDGLKDLILKKFPFIKPELLN
jgi:hypothetical protein